MRRWIVDVNGTALNETWASCNVSSSNDADPFLPSFLRGSFCLTKFAAPLYIVFVAISVFLFFYHLLLVCFWPRLYKKWESEATRRGDGRGGGEPEWEFVTGSYVSVLGRVDGGGEGDAGDGGGNAGEGDGGGNAAGGDGGGRFYEDDVAILDDADDDDVEILE